MRGLDDPDGRSATQKGISDEQQTRPGFRTGIPEDEKFWNSNGKFVARRNLIWSIVAEHIGFSIWLIWSIVATKLPQAGFHYTTDQLFQLVALPGLVGSLMRFPYTFAVTTFGGRNWTIFSASVLFIPTLALAYFVTQPDTPFWLMLLVAATGGTWRRQLRLQHGQYLVLLSGSHEGLGARAQCRRRQYRRQHRAVAGADPDGARHHQSLSGHARSGRRLSAERRADVDPAARHRGVRRHLLHEQPHLGALDFKDQLAIVGRKHTWIMSFIYIGTFGSFIGYSAAFPLLIKTQFPAITVAIAFLGPLVGSLARPLGGLLADKVGGAIVTFWNFIAMGAATIGVMYFVDIKDFAGFLAMFLILFVTTGIGNGSTYRMIPSIFREENSARRQRAPAKRAGRWR